jgi:hypothetical protein
MSTHTNQIIKEYLKTTQNGCLRVTKKTLKNLGITKMDLIRCDLTGLRLEKGNTNSWIVSLVEVEN